MQMNDGTMGFIKASELMGNKSNLPHNVSDTTTSTTTHHYPITTTTTSSFIPASKLISTTNIDRTHSNDLLSNAVFNRHHNDSGVISNESTPSSSSTSHDHQSTSDHFEGVARLKRVKIDPNDLYLDTFSDEECVDSGPSVSGPGMGFQTASNVLLVTSPPLTASSTTLSSGTMSSITSSVKPSTNTTESGSSCTTGGSGSSTTAGTRGSSSSTTGVIGSATRGSGSSTTAGTRGSSSSTTGGIGSATGGSSSSVTASRSRQGNSIDCTTGHTKPLPKITNFFGK